ncbi:MAG: formate dehydrogenase accessory sulfurtransferase FdhD [Vicinamibacteria bacterium]|nr:formate dehydrogenase accessory sulfurtransferase FdhD [Vicinamibacteria bacterium]
MVTLRLEPIGDFTVLCTPTDLPPLAAGYAYTEGLVSREGGWTDFAVDQTGPWSWLVRAEMVRPLGASGGRDRIITRARGDRNLEGLLSRERLKETLRISAAQLCGISETMRSSQEVFQATGGVHAAAVFDASGKVLSFAEDVGRHNALDKALGKCLLEGSFPTCCGAMMSGRLSYDLTAKAVHAGLEVLAGVSAPTMLAVEVAEHLNMTLCGFVREGRMTVYAAPRRITEMKGAE